MKRKAPLKKAEKVSRTTTRSQKGNSAWKLAERTVARYFGTERTGMGQRGGDTKEVPTVHGWLSMKAPDLLVAEGPSWHEPYTHVSIDSKCKRALIPTLEQWHAVVKSNPDRTHLKPVLFLGDREMKLPAPWNYGFVGLCKLDDFPIVYRCWLAYPGTKEKQPSQLLYRFWTIRRPVATPLLITDAIGQALESGVDWAVNKSYLKCSILPVAYLYYPKRITPALAFILQVPKES